MLASNPTTVSITECGLQHYICQRLSQLGIDFKTEVACPDTNSKVDIATNNAVIEVKEYLTCDSIYQAYSRTKIYHKLLEKKRVVIIGLSYPDTAVIKEALALKKNIDSEVLTVIFIDRDSKWFLKIEPSALKELLQGDESTSFLKLKFNPFSWSRIVFICLTLIGITIVSDKSPEKQWEYYNNAVKASNSHDYADATTNFAGLQLSTEGPCIQKYASAMKNASQQAKDAISQGAGDAVASQIFDLAQEKAVRDFITAKCRMPKFGD